MIPVLIAPVISRFDLLERMLASIDVPVERGLIVDNARSGYASPGPEWHVLTPPFNGMGYTGAINAGIMQTADAPWWAWASNDVVFGLGDLAMIAELMAVDEPRLVTFGFTWGALNRGCVDKVGLFDEWSFWPIYFDDADYLNRCILGGVDWVVYEGQILHGADGHANSLTVKSDIRLEDANNRSWALNLEAYIDKWGGRPGHEKYDTPWNSGLPLWATKPDLAGRVARAW